MNKQFKIAIARVHKDSLECYNWKDGDILAIFDKDTELDPENGAFVYASYNITRNSLGGIITDQFILTDLLITTVTDCTTSITETQITASHISKDFLFKLPVNGIPYDDRTTIVDIAKSPSFISALQSKGLF